MNSIVQTMLKSKFLIMYVQFDWLPDLAAYVWMYSLLYSCTFLSPLGNSGLDIVHFSPGLQHGVRND